MFELIVNEAPDPVAKLRDAILDWKVESLELVTTLDALLAALVALFAALSALLFSFPALSLVHITS